MPLSIPKELHREIGHHKDIRWSNIARQAFEKKIKELHWMDKVLEKSELTKEDIDEIDHKIKAEILKRFKK